jgi:4-carboxymuconolactone decarboxylase
MTRNKITPYDSMSAEQKKSYDTIFTGPRQIFGGPFPALVVSPQLCDNAQELGLYVRFNSSLSGQMREMVILLCVRHWNSQNEWNSHTKFARQEKLDESIIEQIRTRNFAPFENYDFQTIREFTMSLLACSKVPDPLYESTFSIIGQRGIADLVSTIGYYCLVCLTLTAFDVDLPDGVLPQLDV